MFVQQRWWTAAELESWGSCALKAYEGCNNVDTVCMRSRACFDSWGAETETWCGVNGHEVCPLALCSHWVVELPARVEGFNICFPRALVPVTSTDTLLGRKRRSERDLASANSFSLRLMFKKEGSELSFGLF